MKPDQSFTFRGFAHDGSPELAVHASSGILRGQDHTLPVVETMINALQDRPAECRLVLTVEDTEPFEVI